MNKVLLFLTIVVVFACNNSSNNAQDEQAVSDSSTVEVTTPKDEIDTTVVVPRQAVNQKPLSEQLWEFVSTCQDAIINSSYAENDYDKIIDDAQNGYLHIEGDFPTCGCACLSTVGGYKKPNGSYTLLKYEEWSCGFDYGIYSNENLDKILPENFGLNAFISDNQESLGAIENGHFFLETEIPQHGTETIFNLRVIPFGMNNECQGGICTTTRAKGSTQKYLRQIGDFIEEPTIKNSTLKPIMKNELHNITISESALLKSLFESEYSDYALEDFQLDLRRIHEGYRIYQKLEYTTLVMDWDREKGRFVIKEKRSPVVKSNFLDYLKANRFYSPAC